MEMRNIQNKNQLKNFNDYDYVNIRGINNINGSPIEIIKPYSDDLYDIDDNYSPRIDDKINIDKKKLKVNDPILKDYEIINSPLNNKLEIEKNNDKKEFAFKKQGSNETVDINFLVNNLNRIEKKNTNIRDIGEAFVHRKFDSLHAFYLENIRSMKFFTSNVLYPNIENPLDILNLCNYAIVIQKIEVYEILAGCQTKNRYKIYVRDNNGNLIYLFKCKENSSYCARTCLRPILNCISHFNEEKLGEIYEPYRCCEPFFKIINKQKQEMFDIQTDYCQKGISCRKSSCGKYSEVKFDIYKANLTDKDVLDENILGNIIRRVPKNVDKSVLSDSDNFEINFPPESTSEEKLLILGSTMLIDYRFFENQSTYKRSAYLY